MSGTAILCVQCLEQPFCVCKIAGHPTMVVGTPTAEINEETVGLVGVSQNRFHGT
jgi:hypothetical protein